MPLPDSLLNAQELPLPEDVIARIIREAHPDVHVTTRIPNKPTDWNLPMILVRGYHNFVGVHEDPRFTMRRLVSVQTFAENERVDGGFSGDKLAGMMAEAVRVTLRDASERRLHFPDMGSVLNIRMTSAPRRVADWATATGPVQYADLPEGAWRWESIYRLAFKRLTT